MKKISIAKLLLFATGYMMLHWPCANATTPVFRQELDTISMNSRSVLVYPNPVMAALNIQSRKPIQQLILYAMDGRTIKKVATRGKRNQLYVQDIKSGAYMLNTIFEDGTRTSKMIIKQ
ncbi:T9SS type A sorting domain-containing protein [Chitinophaga eiseniae]|uniref:T9SS type A sorting domain-containing protein n=1 Tax=Chitinophaga eiseniae TaxID=634771 RepID=A0A847SH67_9BACT|nr:T9SS type A sorting domain-containing protein [Chitinophaga eiseniae]NLR81171.1 T9SS type A sorting domain-containing protein [Chitinophaga eiseniae]